jgi:hypothetical protein
MAIKAAQTTHNRLTNNRIRNSYKKCHKAYQTTKKISIFHINITIQPLKSNTSKTKRQRNYIIMIMMMTANHIVKTHWKTIIMTNITRKVKTPYSITIKKLEVTVSKIIINKIGMISEQRNRTNNNKNQKNAIYAIIE